MITLLLIVFILVLTSILSLWECAQGFCPDTAYRRPVALATKFHYRNENDNDNNDNDKANDEDDHVLHRLVPDPNAILAIPVLGYPIPGQAPLLVVGEQTLLAHHQMTPMQWHAIEEAVLNHQQHVQDRRNVDESIIIMDQTAATTCSSIDAAPLVAILDQATSSLSTTRLKGGRYATIAAVLGGFSSSSSLTSSSIDTSDNASFMESLRSATTDQMTTRSTKASLWNSNIRLLGVGRAVVTDFYYQMPSRIAQDTLDDEGYLLKARKLPAVMTTRVVDDDDIENDDDDDDDDDDDLRAQVLMARFKVLRDDVTRRLSSSGSSSFATTKSASPVHYVAAMANLAQRVEFLHQDRRQLVAGLHAAKARLTLRDWKDDNRDQNIYYNNDDFLEDYDGLGMLMASHREFEEEREATQQAIDNLLEMTTPAASPKDDDKSDNADPPTSPPPTTVSLLNDLENYGMGFTATSVSKLSELTRLIIQERLNGYYSQQCKQSEEFYYEMLSFVAMSSLDAFLKQQQQPQSSSTQQYHSELAWALTCTNTMERIEHAYDCMSRHVQLLKREAEQESQKLRDCGEECTDLW